MVDGGDLSVSPSAALVGSQGLQAVIDDNNPLIVIDESPTAETRYRHASISIPTRFPWPLATRT